jgi:hypothetical protein
MPIRKCRQIEKAVDKYYSDLYFRHDLALRASLATVQTMPPSLGRFLAEICMIADWGSIPQFPFDDRVTLAGEIEICWPLLQTLRTLHSEDWAAKTGLVASAVDVLSRTRLLRPAPIAKNQLSFLSKYLHLCINDAFPIWDKNARTALAHTDNQATWASYKVWLDKVRQEVADQTACLEQLRQPGENLVRTLDKALYVIGQKVLKRQAQLKDRANRLLKNASSGGAQTVSINVP